MPVEGHTWIEKGNWGYKSFTSADSLFRTYSSFINRLEEFIKLGLSAAVYTQTTDVEVETNGFMTYDRRVMKMPIERLKEVNSRLYNAGLAIKQRNAGKTHSH